MGEPARLARRGSSVGALQWRLQTALEQLVVCKLCGPFCLGSGYSSCLRQPRGAGFWQLQLGVKAGPQFHVGAV